MWDRQEDREERIRANLKHTATRTLYRYWDDLRADRPAPLRREIEPAEIGPILSDTFILEASDDATYGYRLAGTRICAIFGRELKGENWLAAWPEQDRAALSTGLRSIVCDAAGVAILFTGRNDQGQSAPFETLLLPLTSRGKGFTRILGATLPLDEPYWLGAFPLTELSMTGLRLFSARDDLPPTGSTETLRPQDILPLRRRKHLALYDGGLTKR